MAWLEEIAEEEPPEPEEPIGIVVTGNLDPDNRDRVLSLVFDYVREEKATLVAVTHEHDLLDRFPKVIDMAELNGKGDS